METRYGISKKNFYEIIDVLKNYSEIVEEAILFGSRARGDFKQTSDIDIAIKFKKSPEKIYSIMEDIERRNIIYTMDIIDYDKISNEKLKGYVDSEGEIIFLSDEEGGFLLNINKLKYKLDDLKRAFNKLKESANRDPIEDDIVIDATIQRFEFTYELSWKLMKAYLEYNGNMEATSPRRAIKESFKEGLIGDGQVWLEMLQDRNRTSHTYDEECAMEIFNHIRNSYIDVFEKLIGSLEEEILQ
ncbi:nucleotidyltransferase substrate binding protein, HI0074 family [Peptoclostridium litorale DSM 5388]|uniref:Nucleotidyltransferase n=2 Tax=Peptoclostridium litorale TaxID=1557 RepID=A0A069RD13_PEPLI|nr:HI0074 family nucleotidyltransferase substrate-binding subunit [Peptoclostridium litorale]KDR94638.1 nucleotidyltransferase [Peptoclostridium litorale DSM 5388]SIO30472.1 nucleotidyltransferase substrate binding protein, HI0074 family [Peptoclostridium litorale DSM 5388]